MNYKCMPNVSYHIALPPKYSQNVVVSLRINEKTPENITQSPLRWKNSQVLSWASLYEIQTVEVVERNSLCTFAPL